MLNKISLKKLFMDIGGQRGGVRSLAPPLFANLVPILFVPPPSAYQKTQIDKKWSENASERVNLKIFLPRGKDTSLPLDPIPAQSRPFRPCCVGHNNSFKISPPPLEILCPRLDIAKIYEIVNISCKQLLLYR